MTEVKRQITTNLDTNSTLIAVENKISNVSNLVQKKLTITQKLMKLEKKMTDHNHDKYNTTRKFNKLTAEHFTARSLKANLVTKTVFDNKLISLNKNFNWNKTKHILLGNELKKLKTLDSIYFRGKWYIENDGTQNYLVFQLVWWCFEKVSSNNNHI